MLYTRVGICLFLLLGPIAIPAMAKIVFHAKRDGQSDIYVINDDGSGERRLTFTPARDFNPRWSPDGKHIAFRRKIPGEIIKIPGEQIQTYTSDVFLMDADGSNQRNLTNTPSINAVGSWSPDGRHIAFTSSRSGRLNIHLITVESGAIEQLTHNGGATAPHYSPNGREIIYVQHGASFWSNIFLMTADGTRQQPLLPPKPGLVIRAYPRFSPDGSRILYADETYKERVEHDANGKTIFLDVMSSDLKIQHRHSNTNQHIKLPKNWRPGIACYMQNGNEILFAADTIGLITKEHGNYDLYRYRLSTGHIQQITDHPASDESPDWVEGRLSVSGREKLATQWGRIKTQGID